MFNVYQCYGVTGKFLAPVFCADDASTNVRNDSQVTFPFWPIARRYRNLMLHGAMESLVSFPRRSIADQSANDASTNVPNVS